MIIVTNQKLQYNDKTYKCSIGLNGLCYNKIEGDQKTPIGTTMAQRISTLMDLE